MAVLPVIKEVRHIYIKVNEDIVEPGIKDPNALAPGLTILKSGNLSAGYYGVMSHEGFGTFTDGMHSGRPLTATFLADQCKFTNGRPMNDLSEWFKFAYANSILFVPKRILRYYFTFHDLDDLGGETEKTEIHMTTGNYKVKLLTPEQWRILMQPLITDKWGEKFNSEDIDFLPLDSNGSCQILTFGYANGVDGKIFTPQGQSIANIGWRPALEFIPPQQ